eukprot:jgi/Botrbrau1/6932/Bobra.0215s0011.1
MYNYIKRKVADLKTGKVLKSVEINESASPASVLAPPTPPSSKIQRSSSRNSLVGVDFENFYTQTTPPPLLARISPRASRQASVSGEVCPLNSCGSYTVFRSPRSGTFPRSSSLSFSNVQRSSKSHFMSPNASTRSSGALMNPSEMPQGTTAARDDANFSQDGSGLSLLIDEVSIIPLSSYTEGEESAEACDENHAALSACPANDGNALRQPSGRSDTDHFCGAEPRLLHMENCPAHKAPSSAGGEASCSCSLGEHAPTACFPHPDSNSNSSEGGTYGSMVKPYGSSDELDNKDSLTSVVQPTCYSSESTCGNKGLPLRLQPHVLPSAA